MCANYYCNGENEHALAFGETVANVFSTDSAFVAANYPPSTPVKLSLS